MKKILYLVIVSILLIFISNWYLIETKDNEILMRFDILNKVLTNPYWITKDISEMFPCDDIRDISDVKIIVIHHDSIPAIQGNRIIDIHNYHLQRGLEGFAYHFYIMPNGKTYKMYDIDKKTNHCRNYNGIALGICLNGDFENEYPSRFQYFAYWILVNYYKQKYNLTVYRHGELVETKCCGKNFNTDLNKKHILQWIMYF